MKVVQKMLEKALVLGQRNVYILLSHTTGEQKNPLKCSEKREFISSGMIDKVKQSLGAENIDVNIICGDDLVSKECETNWITGKLCQIMFNYDKLKRINLYLFIGEDRRNSYDWLIKKYNKEDALTHLTIISEGLERPEGAISGTDMRLLVTSGKEDEFIEKEMEAGLSREKAAELYSTLSAYLSDMEIPAKKRKTTVKTKLATTRASATATGGKGKSSKGKRSKCKRSKCKSRNKSKCKSRNKKTLKYKNIHSILKKKV
jgi:hypothetical protein